MSVTLLLTLRMLFSNDTKFWKTPSEVHSGNHPLSLRKRTVGNFKEQLNENATKGYFQFQIYKFLFIFYFHFFCHVKMKCWYFDTS